MNKRSVTIFAVIEIILYIIFLILDFSDANETTAAVLKFISIIICTCVTITALIRINDGTSRLSAVMAAIAMIFTVISDFFLLFADDILPGLITFGIVHIVYLIVIMGADRKHVSIALLIRIFLTALGVISLKDLLPDGILFLAAVLFYAISFLGNIFHLTLSIILKKNANPCLFRRPVMYLVGMILFVLCDINVLLYNLGDHIAVDTPAFATLSRAAVYLIWIFYLPSQVLIVLSNLRIVNNIGNP